MRSDELLRTLQEGLRFGRFYLKRHDDAATKKSSSDDDETSESLYAVLHDKLTYQLDAVDSIDAKVATVFTFANAIVPILAAVLVAERSILKIVPVSIVAGLSGAAYLAGMTVLFLAYRAGQWELGPDRAELFHHVVDEQRTARQIRVWMAGELITALNKNDAQLAKKARSLDQALLFLIFQVVCGASASLLSIFG